MLRKLILRNSSPHRRRRRLTPARHIHHPIHEFRPAPLLMLQQLHLLRLLLPLHVPHVREHALVPERTCELRHDESVGVEAGQGDELPGVPELSEVVVEAGEFRVGHSGGVPVEARTEVVGEHLVGEYLFDAFRELARIGDAGLARLHPNQIRMRSIRTSTPNAIINPRLDPIIPLPHATRLPIEVDRILPPEYRIGNPTRGRIAQRIRIRRLPLPHHLRPPPIHHPKATYLIQHRLPERHGPRLLRPLPLHARRIFPSAAAARRHPARNRLPQRNRTGRSRPQNKRMIPPVHVRIQQRRRLGVRPRDDDQLHAQHVRRQPRRDQSIGVFPRRYQHLPAHVAAFFRAGFLILEVYPGGARLDEELDEFHYGGEASVAGVAVGDHGGEVVDLGREGGCCRVVGEDGGGAFFVLAAIVVELGAYELIALIWHRIHGIIGEVRTRFIGAARRARTLPSAHVDTTQMRSHLHDLDRIQCPEGM
mmetsp:Transcript_13080/g.21367  ORF Transcript_13080/g.21367 Transcript_13080/m.21367 type:complete len:479 (+) Transcript_13080:190-1626(+)